MRFLIAALIAALVVPLAARPALGATAGGDPTEAESSGALTQMRLERQILQARAARNAALLPGAVGPDLADVAVWLAKAAETLGISISELEAETLLAAAAREQGGRAGAEQEILEDARRLLNEVTAELEAAELAPLPAGLEPRPAEGAEKWRELVARYFPDRIVEEAVNVMQCESEGDPTARNRRSGATGLFQFLRGTWQFAAEAAGVGHLPRTDPEANIAAAAWLVSDSEERGNRRWAHWTCRP